MDRAILRVHFDLVSGPSPARKALGGFLRYVQYRDQHEDSTPGPAAARRVDSMVRYVSHRDRAVSRGRLFVAQGQAGDAERRAFTGFVAQSIRATQPLWGRSRNGERFDRRRAAYRFVISPEVGGELDLPRLTSAVVAQLETDLGGGVHWIAAEHRNTEHWHVHLVVAGIRELGDGRMSAWILSGQRLARMKGALALAIERQRGQRRDPAGPVSRPASTPAAAPVSAAVRRPAITGPGEGPSMRSPAQRGASTPPRLVSQRPPHLAHPSLRCSNLGLHRLAARYRRELARQAEQERRDREPEHER